MYVYVIIQHSGTVFSTSSNMNDEGHCYYEAYIVHDVENV